ncbi:MAG: peptidyl-tRNA hydrolase [Candidatus Woesearchaeota archaeon]|nr:MAG: peptidyl-tRNA hydrolase [Candidatus Woesearchaeota archaeon]
MLKQVIVVRKDLKLPKGKMAAQVAHASVDAVLASSRLKVAAWRRLGMKKIVVYAEDKVHLAEIAAKAKDAGLKAKIITDAGHTVVEPGTVTCLGIGPEAEAKIDAITQDLQLV